MDANHKFDTSVVFTFLENEKELVLCCVNRERQELLLKKQKQDHFKSLQMKMKIQKQSLPEEAR